MSAGTHKADRFPFARLSTSSWQFPAFHPARSWASSQVCAQSVQPVGHDLPPRVAEKPGPPPRFAQAPASRCQSSRNKPAPSNLRSHHRTGHFRSLCMFISPTSSDRATPATQKPEAPTARRNPHSPPSQTAFRPWTNRTGSSATIPIALGAFGWRVRSVCSKRGPSYASGLGICPRDQVVETLGDCWSSRGVAPSGWCDPAGFEGVGRVVAEE